MNSRRIFRALIAASLLFAIALLLAPLPSAAKPLQRFRAFGLVVSVDAGNGFTVSCKEIPGFMDAMEMHLDASDAQALKTVRPGEMIDFTLVVGDDTARAEDIRLHHFQSAEQRQLEARCLSIITAAAAPTAPATTTRTLALAVGDQVPDFTLIDQHHRPVKTFRYARKNRRALLHVHALLLHAVLSCASRTISASWGRRFPAQLGTDLALMTITFDPKNDTPEVLEKYSENWSAAANGWYFLTGPTDDVKRACLEFGMNFWPDMGMIAHDMHTVIIDRSGHLLANLEGNDFSATQLGDLLASAMARPQ